MNSQKFAKVVTLPLSEKAKIFSYNTGKAHFVLQSIHTYLELMQISLGAYSLGSYFKTLKPPDLIGRLYIW